MNVAGLENFNKGCGWDSSWASLDRRMLQLYTRGRPQNIHQFWQRCYFEDLWRCMGANAARASYLELGAGRGTTSMYLASRNCNVTMLDLSSEGFKIAESNFLKEGLKPAQMIQADAQCTGLPSESYDCIFSIGLLEHFDDPRPVLTETARLLRPKGLNFAVIIPERPASIRWLSLLLLRPWALGRQLIPEKLRGALKKRLGPRSASTATVTRTPYSCRDYLEMLKGMDVESVNCRPYNAYHPVYKSAFLEAQVTIPLYRAHRCLKKVYSGYPLLETASPLASCWLLTFRKRAAA